MQRCKQPNKNQRQIAGRLDFQNALPFVKKRLVCPFIQIQTQHGCPVEQMVIKGDTQRRIILPHITVSMGGKKERGLQRILAGDAFKIFRTDVLSAKGEPAFNLFERGFLAPLGADAFDLLFDFKIDRHVGVTDRKVTAHADLLFVSGHIL